MRQLSKTEKWCYAIGNIPQAVKDTAFGSFVVFYYTQVLGLSGTLAGLAMLIAMVWDAISDPIVGSWCDSVKSRFGRRHPLLFIGGISTACLFLLLFRPPAGLSEVDTFLWLTLISVFIRTTMTVYFIPYQAMGAEMSSDYDERTVIAKARVTMAFLGAMVLPAIAYGLIFQSSADTDGRLVAANYWDYGLISFAMALSSTLICLWGTKTTIPSLPQATPATPKFSFTKPYSDFLVAASNKNFRATIGTNLAFGICAGTYATMGLYIATYYWEFSSSDLAGFVIPTFLATMTAFFLINRIGRRYDKNRLMSFICLAFSINVAWLVTARLLGWLPDNGHPVLLQLQWLQIYIGVGLIASLAIIVASLMADILDQQEVDTGIRQDGVFFAAASFVTKTTTGVGSFVAGLSVDLSGLKPGMTPGFVPDSVLMTLGWFYGPGIALFALIAWLFSRRITLSRTQTIRIQAELLQKKHATSND